MWFATQDGLNRWDGYEMKVYKHQPFDTTTLTTSWIIGLDEDQHGNIWMATRSGLNRLDPVTEEVTSWKHNPEDPSSIPSDNLGDVKVTSDGTVWLGTWGDGLVRMRPGSSPQFTSYRHSDDNQTTISSDKIFLVEQDSRGRIWAGTPNGVSRLDDPDAGVFSRFYSDVDKVICDFDGESAGYGMGGPLERPEEPGVGWFGSELALIRMDLETGAAREFKIEPDEPCSGPFKPVQDPLNPGVLWMGYGDGLVRFDIRTETFQWFKNDSNDPSSIPEGFVDNTFVDRSGVVWVANNPVGMSYFDPSSVSVGLVQKTADESRSIIGQSVTSMFLGRDGILWVISGGSEWGLTALDRDRGTATHYRHDPADPSSISEGFYWGSVVEDDAGNIWVGAPEFGLDRLDRRSGNFLHYRHDPDDPTSIAADRVQSLYVDHTGSLWIGHPGAMSRMAPDRPGIFQRYVGVPDDDATIFPWLVRTISEDRAGFIWLAQNEGVARVDPISGNVTRFKHDPSDPSGLGGDIASHVHERKLEPGIVWITFYGAGLDRFDPSTGEVTHYTEEDGLSNNGAYGMLEDGQGRLWISTNRGISRFDPATETFRNYGTEIGLQGLEFNSGSFHKGYTGEFFFGGQYGMNSFFPNELAENSTPPQVTLVDLKLFNESVARTGAVDIGDGLDQIEEVELDYDQRDIEFDFVAFHYTDPESNEYAYKLEGWNDDWVYIGNKRSASFTNLDPGEYTLRVKAANSDGVWNEEGTSLTLVVTPPFWATWWFRILAVLAFAGVIFGGYRWRTAQLESRARELEGEVNARTAQLKASNEQLEQSHGIVTAINQETSFTRVLNKILEEARVIPGVEKATALVYMPSEGVFRVRASSGWDVEDMADIILTDRQARKRYVEDAEEVAEDIFIAKNVSAREGADQMAEFGEVASFLVLRINVEGEVAGYLVFDNLSDPDAFASRDVQILERLRGHIQSAFIKTRILEDLQTTLTDLKSTQNRLIQSEKMASLGELTAGIAHEIKNPLNFVNNFAEVAAEMAEEAKNAESPDQLNEILDELRENLLRIEQHARRADGIVENMMQHATGLGEIEPTDINDLLDEYVGLAYHGMRARHGDFEVEIQKNYDRDLRKLDVVPQEIGKVFLNILGNGFDAMRQAESEHPRVSVSTKRNGSNVEIRISDNGPGIPDDVKSKIFEPFFTTKPTGSGTGLGLSMSYDIITKGHGGELEVESSEGKGATFIVRLLA
jgi:signal transduction histidine kinase/ligand-binding sensor domain-containing protein